MNHIATRIDMMSASMISTKCRPVLMRVVHAMPSINALHGIGGVSHVPSHNTPSHTRTDHNSWNTRRFGRRPITSSGDFILLTIAYFTCTCRMYATPYRRRLRYVPVWLPATCATASGVPSAIIVPPPAPPSGPRSISQSADLIMSRLCSMMRTLFPISTN